MKVEGLPVIDVDEGEKITVAVRADDLLEGVQPGRALRSLSCSKSFGAKQRAAADGENGDPVTDLWAGGLRESATATF